MGKLLYTFGMSTRRNVFTFSSLFAIPLILLSFQNCAPPSGDQASTDSGDATVGIIEDFNKTSLQFVAPRIDVQSEVSSTSLSGLCSRRHGEAQLTWALWSNQKSVKPLLSGVTKCGGGAFSIDLDQMEQLTCGVRYVVMVEGEWGGATHTYLSRRCFPLASRVDPVPAGSPLGTTCTLEYMSSAEGNCQRLCYRDDKVVMQSVVESSMCSGLMAKVAGP